MTEAVGMTNGMGVPKIKYKSTAIETRGKRCSNARQYLSTSPVPSLYHCENWAPHAILSLAAVNL